MWPGMSRRESNHLRAENEGTPFYRRYVIRQKAKEAAKQRQIKRAKEDRKRKAKAARDAARAARIRGKK